MELYFIRHGKTEGNLQRRYVGRTDEPLHSEGIAQLEAHRAEQMYPPVQYVFASPMMRCIETAHILYPNNRLVVVPDFRERDFGDFENKNFDELKDVPAYRRWLGSNGALPFPGGEEQEAFQRRCCAGFVSVLKELFAKKARSAALVIHGGTIMSILSKYGLPRRGFYGWQISNGDILHGQVTVESWKEDGGVQVVEDMIK